MAVDRAVHAPAYRVETDRLMLRCWSPGDATVLRQALDESDAHLRPWIPFMKDEPRTLAQTAQWLRGARADFDRDVAWHYAVFDRRTGQLLGGNMLNPRSGPGSLELGYWTRKGHTGQGVAAEATCAMVRVAFEIHRAQRVEIHCSPENQASAAIPRKLGFTHEATLRARVSDTEGVVRDLMIWSLFAAQFPGSPASGLGLSVMDSAGLELALKRPDRLAGDGS